MKIPLLGGDYDSGTLNSTIPLMGGDLIAITGHESPLIPNATYRVDSYGVARHVPNPMSTATFWYMAHQVEES